MTKKNPKYVGGGRRKRTIFESKRNFEDSDKKTLKKIAGEATGMEKTAEFVLGESHTDDGTGKIAKRLPNEVDDFISSDEVTF